MITMTMSEVALWRRGIIFADAAWILLDDGDLPSNVAWLYDEWINIRSLLRLETHKTIGTVCINCNKSIRAVSMHLGITGARHVVNIINHG